MPHPLALEVQGLGKSYRLGARQQGYVTLREAIVNAGRRLNPFDGGREDEAGEPTTLWALKDVTFEVQAGEALGIIGRNGAGKSTLLKILSRITSPSEGRVDVFGRVGSLLEVGTGFHPELTGRENVFLNGAILGMRRSDVQRRFDEIVAFSEVDRFIDTPVKRYSSGMYLRLAFAVAAHLEPEILVVDEVLAVGDAAFQRKCIGKMGAVAKTGRTVLFVSHNLTAVKSLCSRCVWLDKGTVVQVGDSSRVVADYLHKDMMAVRRQAWDDTASAPGNDKVRMRLAEIAPQGEPGGAGITVQTPLRLHFEAWNFIPQALLHFTVHLHTIEGTHVFASVSRPSRRAVGPIRDAVLIPADLLNDGVYSVTVQIVQDTSSTVFVHPDVLTFEVHDVPRAGSWFGKWPGVVRPVLSWESDVAVDPPAVDRVG